MNTNLIDTSLTHTHTNLTHTGTATIVIAVTNAATAIAACQQGLALVRKSQAQVHLVYGIPTNDPQFEAKRDRQADGLLESISMSSGRPATLHAIVGRPHEAILDIARRHNADLIVIGNRGLTKHGRFTRQVPARVLRGAKCSVLVVDTAASAVRA